MMTSETSVHGYLAMIGAAAFVVAWALGTALNLTFGPAFGGFANAFATAFVVGVGVSSYPKFISPIIIWLAFSALAIFSTTMGPPGAHKLLIGVLTGLVVGAFVHFLPNRGWAYFLAGFAMSVFMTTAIMMALIYLNVSPEAGNKLLKALPFLLPVYGILGGLGMWYGHRVFSVRLSRLRFFEGMPR